MSKKFQDFDLTYEEQAALAERLNEAEKHGVYVVSEDNDNRYDLDMLDDLLTSRMNYLQNKEDLSSDCYWKNEKKNTLPIPKLNMEIRISEISNFNIVNISDGLKTISIDLNTLSQSDEDFNAGSINDIIVISKLRLMEILPNFYPSAIIPSSIPIKTKITNLVDYDNDKFKFYEFSDDTIIGYYMSDESVNNYNTLVDFCVSNGIFLSLMRCLNSITSEDGFTFRSIMPDRLNQMMMTSAYADSSKVIMRLIEIDDGSEFTNDDGSDDIYKILGYLYPMDFEISNERDRRILGDYCDDNEECYDESDDDFDDFDEDEEESPEILSDDITNSKVSITTETKQTTIELTNPIIPGVTLNGVPIDSNTDIESLDDSDNMDDLFSDDNFPTIVPTDNIKQGSSNNSDNSFVIKRR